MAAYQSEIRLTYADKTVNGKSVWSLLTAAIPEGSALTVTCRGSDEAAMLQTVSDFLQREGEAV